MVQALCQQHPKLMSRSCVLFGRDLFTQSHRTSMSYSKGVTSAPSSSAGHILTFRTSSAANRVPPTAKHARVSKSHLDAARTAPWTSFSAVRRSQVAALSSLSSLRTSTTGEAVVSTPEGSTHVPTDKNIVDVLKERGLVETITNEDELRKAAEKPIRVYCGFDPTADSLHLGNLLGIIVLEWFQRHGHSPVALLGGATGRVGDPSGKSSERPMMDDATLNANADGIKRILQGLLQVPAEGEAGGRAAIMNNIEWFGSMGFLEFLRDVGKNARVGVMMAKDSVKTRLDGDGMSFTEFAYQLLQGYDFVHLYKNHNVQVQVGGSDQWGNITAGTDLIRRMVGSEASAFGLTFPLLLKSDGNKFGKSEDGAVWLTADKLSPYKFYQYMFAVPDVDVIRMMRSLTFLPMEEIAALEEAMSAEGYRPNTAQIRLAEEVTTFVHGEEGLRLAQRATEAMRPGSKTELDADVLDAIIDSVPNTRMARDDVVGQSIVDVMAGAGLQKSKGEARRLIKGGGASLNNVKVQDQDLVITAADALDGRLLLLAAGKKNKMLVRID